MNTQFTERRPDAMRELDRGSVRLTDALARALGWGCAVLAAAALGACDAGNGNHAINGAIHVPAGQPPTSVATVNGPIVIDADAAVTSATTVNGDIQAGTHVTAQSFTTVNGSIDLGNGDRIDGGVTSINGSIRLSNGSDVSGAVSNVTGSIDLANAHVGGGIKTSNGNINILGQSRVQGGILVEAATVGVSSGGSTPRIVIGPNADVQGPLRFEHPVQLYVSDQATIGPVTGATPIRFSGDEPSPGGPELSSAVPDARTASPEASQPATKPTAEPETVRGQRSVVSAGAPVDR
jgi:hypothetical protein